MFNYCYLLKKARALLLLSAVCAFSLQAFAAGPVAVTGTVKDPKGSALAGVTISAQQSAGSVVAITDTRGEYRIDVEPDAVLIFSFLGYVTQTVPVEGQRILDLIMTENMTNIDQVVVVGYGSMKKGEVTGAISSVRPDDFQRGLVKSPEQLLQGKVAGLQVINPTGDPVLGLQMNIRGTNSLAGTASPLVIIDGIPGGSMTAISAEDIESFDVLKDGSAAAIYGTQGTNGVIIITTKAPRASTTSLEYDGSVAIEAMSNKQDVLNAADYRRLIGEEVAAFSGLRDNGATTDWQDRITRLGVSQNHYVTLKGGSAQSSYVASVDYRDRKGVVLNSDRESITARMALNHNMFDNKLRIQLNFNDSYVTQRRVWYNSYLSALINNPTSPVYNEDGSYFDSTDNLQPHNPVSLIKEEYDVEGYNQLMVNAKVIYSPIENLNLSAMGALQRFDRMENKSNTFDHMSTLVYADNGNVWNWADNWLQKTFEFVGDYTFSKNGHSAIAMAGYSYQNTDSKGIYQWAKNFPTDMFGPWNIGASDDIKQGKAALSSYRNAHTLISFFGRLNYNYKDRYMVMASLRREGSSRFGANNKWGTFTALSLGWSLSNEAFLKDVKAVDNLKLRFGYGITGTEAMANYASLYMLRYSGYGYVNGEWTLGTTPAQNSNPDLKWETKTEYNFGVDFGFWQRISGSIDLYHRTSSDLLGYYSVPTPPYPYGSMLANVGEITNKGVEFSLNANLIRKKNMSLEVGGNISFNKNEVVSLSNDMYHTDYMYEGATGSPIQTYTHLVETGQPVGNFYGFRTVDMDDNGKFLVEGADGEPKLLSAGTESDKRVIGNGVPTTFAAFHLSFVYKNFDIYASLRGAFDFDILNSYRMMWETTSRAAAGNLPRSVLDKPFGSDSYITDSPGYHSFYLEKGNYVKLDNVSVGYNIPLGKQKVIQKLRVYASAYNVLTLTSYSGLDPEVGMTGLAPGVEGANGGELYPTVRTFTLGLNITF